MSGSSFANSTARRRSRTIAGLWLVNPMALRSNARPRGMLPERARPVTTEQRPTPRPPVLVPHPVISLWQSAVNQAIAERTAAVGLRGRGTSSDPYAVAVDGLAAARHLHAQSGLAREPASLHERILGHALATSLKQIHAGNMDPRAAAETLRRFSDQDLEFVISCVSNFLKWYLQFGRPKYRDWRQSPEKLKFGVIKYRLPKDAKVALIGDWGTGMPDAAAMLTALLAKDKPDVLIHLGDVYYSGTKEELRHNFRDVITSCCQDAGLLGRIPVFSIPGNHDYYSGGTGFYETLDVINSGDQIQQASYFCLRTADDSWQFLGLDTGRHDHVPGLPFEPFYSAPHLEPSEVDWAVDKLRSRARTILLTHHQLFSARSPLNGALSFHPPHLNQSLLSSFRAFFPQIAMWFWGHEHSLALFKDGLFELSKGRLVGCSAFESPAGDGYSPRYLEVGYEPPEVRLGLEHEWLNHGCAIVDLGSRTVSYYEYPSWGGEPPAGATLNLLAREEILGGR